MLQYLLNLQAASSVNSQQSLDGNCWCHLTVNLWVLCRDCIPSAVSQLLSLLVLLLPTYLAASKKVPPDRQTPFMWLGCGCRASVTICEERGNCRSPAAVEKPSCNEKNPRCFWLKQQLTFVTPGTATGMNSCQNSYLKVWITQYKVSPSSLQLPFLQKAGKDHRRR